MIGDDELRTCLAEQWRLTRVRISVHNGGMNSATWLLRRGGECWVAKAVAPASERLFVTGLAVASALQQAGLMAGAPMPTVDGRTVTSVGGIPLALLTWVPGAPLTGGLLHSDPAPEAFRWDRERDSCGLIDWGVALYGPLLYDVASAVMYLAARTGRARSWTPTVNRPHCPPLRWSVDCW